MRTRLVLEVMTWNAAKSSFLRQHAHCAQGDGVGLEFRPPPLFLSLAPVFMVGGGSAGVGFVANFVDSIRICSALFSPVLVGCHVQGGVEQVPQPKLVVGRPLNSGPPPVWPFTLDTILMLWMTRSSGVGNGGPAGGGQSRVSVFAEEKPNLFVLWRGDHARGAGFLSYGTRGRFCGSL